MVDQVRARAARTKLLELGDAAGERVKHTDVTVGVAESLHVLDPKCTQVAIANTIQTGQVYVRFDSTAVTTANGYPVTQQSFDVEGGGTLRLIADLAGQTVRIVEVLLA